MTKALAPSYLVLRATTGLNLSSLNLKLVALDATYVYSSAHDFLNDVDSGAIVATSGNLASKTTTAGVFDSADVSLGSPAGGDTITQFWLYYDSGSGATSSLIYYFNEDAAGSAISISTDGTEKTVTVNASGWFR
jgi:hypothetical protein